METTATFSPQKQSTNEVAIIPRSAIPAISSVQHEGQEHQLGEVRDFQWHETLKNFLPDLGYSFSWVRLKSGESLKPHVHPTKSMIIIVKGNGQLTGQKNQIFSEGDIIIVPPGCSHGFECRDAEGFHALSIQFEGGLYTQPQMPRVEFTRESYTLQKLLDYNQVRLKEFSNRPFFTMIENGTLDDAKKRQIYLDSLQIWTEGNQTLLFARQGTCHDENFRKVFLKHLQEEVGHDDLYNDRDDHKEKTNFKDAGMTAITTWFLHQMFVLDNLEKAAIIHLVIESASDEYHTRAKPFLAKYINDKYFEAHAIDCDHIQMGVDLLDGYSAKTYRRLHEVIDKAWDMLNSMVDRVTFLVQNS
jgi:quercetin dioxygenase-like cupin family protein